MRRGNLSLAREVDRLLDARQRARLRELNGIERLLFKKLIGEFKGELEESGDGRITSRRGFLSISKAIDVIFDAVEARGLDRMGQNLAVDMKSILAVNSAYYRSLKAASAANFKAIEQAVLNTMNRRLGIDQSGGVQKDGYLGRLFRTDPARDEVKQMVSKAVAGGIPMKNLERQLRVKVEGTKGTAGVLEKHIGGFVLDSYNVADRVLNNDFGKKLGLRYFLYSGGLIETSREFCRRKNGKVFSTDEAEAWPAEILKIGPATKAEQEAGVLTDYIPLEDVGRWRCRHRLLFISDQMAFSMRPDLKPAA